MVLAVEQEEELLPLVFYDKDGNGYEYLPPTNKWELQAFLKLLFGAIVPDKAVCPGHCAPLDAIAASYFATSPVVVWKASRGFGGKTTMLGNMSQLELLLGANVNVLGGSGLQSQRVVEVAQHAWDYTPEVNGRKCISPFTSLVPKRPGSWRTYTKLKTKLVALTASQRSVRGGHPERLRLDEADEMSWDIYKASMGQTMDNEVKDILSQTTISSTHQYPDATMTEILKQAAENGWPVMEWCWRENHVDNKGWLTQSQIDRKRQSVTEQMWNIEYDLQEPSIEGRAFNTEYIQQMFTEDLGIMPEWQIGKRYIFQRRSSSGLYATGCDWARDTDWAEIITIRYDCTPARLVAYERVKDEAYPLLVARFENQVRMYESVAAHDATGVGSAVMDWIDLPDVIDYQTKSKRELYNGLQLAVERGRIQCPKMPILENQFKYMKRSAIYGREHPPDGVCAMALALIAAGLSGGPIKASTRPGKMKPAVVLERI